MKKVFTVVSGLAFSGAVVFCFGKLYELLPWWIATLLLCILVPPAIGVGLSYGKKPLTRLEEWELHRKQVRRDILS